MRHQAITVSCYSTPMHKNKMIDVQYFQDIKMSDDQCLGDISFQKVDYLFEILSN